MSLYTDASLIMYPSGYKEDKIYSLKPTDGSGDLTFTRASTATRVNADGLIEGVRTNLITYSEQFDNAAWVKTRLNAFGSGSIVNAIEAPDGTTSADYIQQETGQTTGGAVSVNLSISGAHSWSVFAKASEFKFLALRTRSATLTISYFDLTNGTIALADPDHSNVKITSFGNGWYRCSLSDEGGALANRFIVGGRDGANETVTPERGVYIWGVQLELSPSATEYIPTTTTAVSVGMLANVPRIDYTGGGCGSLLLEKQSTNLCLWSEDLTKTDWIKQQTTISANSTTSPDGTQNADKLAINNGITGGYVYQLKSTTSGTVYTGSFYIKAGGVNYTKFYTNISGSYNEAVVNLTTGAITNSDFAITPTTQSVGNGWYRVNYTVTSGGGQVVVYIDGGSTSNGGGYTGNGTDGIYIWGAQLEASSYSTSYVPTLASSVTRLADAAFKTGISSLIGQTEGVVFMDFTVDTISAQTSDPVLWYMKDGGAGERYVELYSNGNLVYTENNGATIAQITKTELTIGRHKCAIAYAANDFVFYVDGVLIGTDVSGTPSGFSTFGLQYYLSTYTGQQKVNQAILFPTRLTNTQLASLTTI